MIHPNQEMFVEVFQNRLNVRHFNESLIEILTMVLIEVVTQEEIYIKCGESNGEKKASEQNSVLLV